MGFVASVKGSLSVIKLTPLEVLWFSLGYQATWAASLRLRQAGVPPHRSFACPCPCRSESNVPQNRRPYHYSGTNPSGMAAWENLPAKNQLKNRSKYTSHWCGSGTLLSQDCYLAKASLLDSRTAAMTAQWTYCTYEASACGSVIFGWMAPWDLQSGTFNRQLTVWPCWKIKKDGENKGCGEGSSQAGRGLTHPFLLLMPEDRVFWTVFLAEDPTALKIRLLLFRQSTIYSLIKKQDCQFLVVLGTCHSVFGKKIC